METVGNRAVSGFYEEQVGVLAEGYSPNACAWVDGNGTVLWTSFDKAPEDGDHFAASYMIDVDRHGSVQFSPSVVSDSLRPQGRQHARFPVQHQLP